MSKSIAYLSIGAAFIAGALGPGVAAAADLYGYEEGGPPLAFHGRDDVFVDGGRARVERGQDLRPGRPGTGFGPPAFDDRGPDRRFVGGYGYGDARRPPYGYGRPVSFARAPRAAPFGYEESLGDRPGPFYRPVGVAGAGYGEGYGGPDAGCTTEQTRSLTPAGWRKTVTYRTCYRR